MRSTEPLSIIVVNWNTRTYLASCLESIENTLPSSSTEVIVVDNASGDRSREMVEQQFPHVHLVANPENKGFARAVNDGLSRAHGRYVLILNPDIVLQSDSIGMLVHYLEEHPGTGAIMPSLRNLDGSYQRGYVRRIPSLLQVIFFHTVLEPWSRRRKVLVDRFLETPVESTHEIIEVEQIPGACLLTRRNVLDGVGLFDERYRLFFEDVDWCYRARKKGWKLIVHNGTRVLHVGGGSFAGDNRVLLHGWFIVSLMTFFDLHKGIVRSLFVKCILLCNSLVVVLLRNIQLLFISEERRDDAVFSRARHLYVLKYFYETHCTDADRPVSTGSAGKGDC